MKHWTLTLAGLVALALLADLAVAQPPGGGRRGSGEQRQRFGQPPGPGGFQFRLPLMVALDADEDGELSADEIKNATKALLTLDKNEDGKLTSDELRPEFGRGGFGSGPGGPPQGGFGRGGFGGPGQGGPGQGGPGGPGRGGPGGGGFVERLMQLDKNDDGKITADEVPERMAQIIQRVDTNGDGTIDKEEAEAFAERIGRGGPPQGGRGRGGFGGPPPQGPQGN